MRTCRKCGVGYETAYCMPCRRAGDKAAATKYRSAHPENFRASVARSRARHRDKRNSRAAKWRLENPEHVAEILNRWLAKNPNIRRVYEQNRNARKTKNGGELSHGLIGKLYKLQRGKCPCCGNPLGENYHLDHVMPLVLGGEHEDRNMQLLRQQCNNQKHAKHPVDFMQSRGFLL